MKSAHFTARFRLYAVTEHRRQVASILACCVIRWHRGAGAAGIVDAAESAPNWETRLELCDETKLSVSDGSVRNAAPRSESSHAYRFIALALALHAGDSGFGEFMHAIAGCDDDPDS